MVTMMMMKSLPVFLVVVLLVTGTEQQPRNRQECSDLIRGMKCSEDNECACPDYETSPLICNYRQRCEKKSFLDYITRKLPCHRIYKSACFEDANCPCNTAPLICENNECVRAKFVHA